MLLTRREMLRLAGLAAISTPLSGLRTRSGPGPRRLFYDVSDVPRIRANAASPLLGSTFQSWRQADPAETRATIDRVLESRELLTDFGLALEAIYREITMLLVTGDQRHEEMVLHGLSALERLEEWDYLREGGTRVLGLMRASKATTCVLFAMEVLGDRIDGTRRTQLLKSVSEKGCRPCALTLHQMDHPEEVVGWQVDEIHRGTVEYDMSHWPTILGHNNLRAIPTMGLGLGALALEGHDPRAAAWLDLAVRSARRFLGLFEKDGSYFEGISYVDYAFRTLFMFLEAHYRIHGDIDWIQEANFRGITEYIVCLQNGKKEDGTPDIVNISDARYSVFPCVGSWIAKRSGDGLAQYAVNHFSRPGFYSDFLWYDPSARETPPPKDLLNKKFDLDWIVSRTGWDADDTVVAFRSGPPMNHEHADRNSIMVKAFGERLLTDPIGASYDPRQPHWLLRKTEAHNAVLIDGKGHQYHNGEEGTNASQASARIVSYDDGGEVVTWSSDATVAYQLVRPEVARVLRSVLFEKSGLLVIVDRLEMNEGLASLSVRFHPDNRDGQAQIHLGDGGQFEIQRPRGVLSGVSAGVGELKKEVGLLDLPGSYGVFPFVDVIAPPATATTVITALTVDRASEASRRALKVWQEGDGWRIAAGERSVEVRWAEGLPIFKIT